jgi:ribosome-binding factor A
MTAPSRRLRVEKAYAQTFSEVLRDLKQPLPALCSVVRVEMSPDLSSATVHVSLLGDGAARARTRESLKRAQGYLQGEIGRRLGLRHTPRLVIVGDPSLRELVGLGQSTQTGTAQGRGPQDGPGGGPEGGPVARGDR